MNRPAAPAISPAHGQTRVDGRECVAASRTEHVVDDRDVTQYREWTARQRVPAVGGELPIVPKRRLNAPVIVVIQPGPNPHPGPRFIYRR